MNAFITLGLLTLASGFGHGDEEWLICRICDGSGFTDLEVTCELCQGEGGSWEICSCCGGTQLIDVSCHLCGGDGYVDCTRCGGEGWLTGGGNCRIQMEQMCPDCRAGQITCTSCEETGILRRDPCTVCVDGEEWVECSGCDGTGVTLVTEICSSCDGQGSCWQETEEEEEEEEEEE